MTSATLGDRAADPPVAVRSGEKPPRTDPNPSSRKKYDAFISYSHAADTPRARAVQSGLQRLAKPWFRLPILKVFRDETSLAANPAAWTALVNHLDDSRYLILFASSKAAASIWVTREVAWWLENRSIETLFLVVSGGELRWDPARKDFDWTTTTCLPGSLRGAFKEEPLYIDLTWATEADLSLRHARFRNVVLALAAPLHGRPKDDLDSDDIRENRRLRRATWSAVVMIACLAVGALYEARIARRNARSAELNAQVAQRSAVQAIARQQAVASQLDVGEGKLGEAARSALVAVRTEDSTDARVALFQTLEASWDIQAVLRLHQAPVFATAFRNDNDELLTWSTDNTLIVWDLAQRKPIRPPLKGAHIDARAAVFSPDAKLLATGNADGSIVLWDVERLEPRATLKGEATSAVITLSFDPAGRRLASGHELDGDVQIWDVEHATLIKTIAADGSLSQDFSPTGLAFSLDGRYFAVANNNPSALVGVWDLLRGVLVGRLMPSSSFWMNQVVAFVETPNTTERALAVGISEGQVSVFRQSANPAQDCKTPVSPGKDGNCFVELGSSTPHEGVITTMAAGSGALATGGSDGRVAVWSSVGQPPTTVATWSAAPVRSLSFGEDAQYLAAGTEDGTVIVYDGMSSRPRSLESLKPPYGILEARSPDRAWIVRGRDGMSETALFHSRSGKRVLEHLTKKPTFSSDSRWLLDEGKEVQVWRLTKDTPAAEPILPSGIGSGVLAASGNLLVTRAKDVELWDLRKSPPERRVIHQQAIKLRGFYAGEKLLLATADDGLHIWDVASATEVTVPIALPAPIGADDDDDDDDERSWIEVSPDGKWIAVGDRKMGSLYQLGKVQGVVSSIPAFVHARFSPDGAWIVVDSKADLQGSRRIHETVWNLSTLTRLPEPDGPADHWVFSKDGRWLASKGLKGGVEVWNLSGPQPRRTYLGLACDAFEFSSDSASLLTVLEDNSGSLVDLRTMKPRVLPVVFGQARAFSPGTHQLANASHTTIQLVDTESNQLETLQGHTKPIADLEFSDDGSILASVDTNGSVILWDPRVRRRMSDILMGPGNDEDSDYHLAFDSSDKSFKLGNISIPAHPDRWAEDLCSRFQTTLSEAEWRAMARNAPYPWRCDSVKGVTGDTLAQFGSAR